MKWRYQTTYGGSSPPVITAGTSTLGMPTATITWTTGKNCNSRADYGTSPTAMTLNAPDPVLATTHSLSLTGLAIRTTYYSRVTPVDVAGNRAISPATSGSPASFTTIDPAVTATPSLGARAIITWTTNKLSNSRVDYGTPAVSLTLIVTNASMVTAHSITLAGLKQGTTYYYSVTSVDALSNNASSSVAPATASFVENAVSVWSPSVTPVVVDAPDGSALEVGMKFRSDTAGIVASVRFYKAAASAGTHTENLWSLLGSVNFAIPLSIAPIPPTHREALLRV